MKPAVKPDGSPYYDLVLCYVDDVISIRHQPRYVIDEIKAVFKLKNDKAEVPNMYLGGKIKEVTNGDGTKC